MKYGMHLLLWSGQLGVTLALECLNRFETYLLNTHADEDKRYA